MKQVSTEQARREAIKRRAYQKLEEHYARAGVGGHCVLCKLGVPGGTGMGTETHHIIPKSENRRTDAIYVHRLANLARACPAHHRALNYLRLIWLKAMMVLHLANESDYLHLSYWTFANYPPVHDCIGLYGYGSEYYQKTDMEESLLKLYRASNPDFTPEQFCAFCPVATKCQQYTKG